MNKTTNWQLTKKQVEVLKHYRDGSPSTASTRVVENLLRKGLIHWVGTVFNGEFQLTKSGEHALKTYETGVWS